MNRPRIERNRSRLLAALLAVGGATPAWAATVRLPFDMYFTTYDYVLGALLVLLVIALLVSITARVNREQQFEEPARAGPDLRWWKGHHQT